MIRIAVAVALIAATGGGPATTTGAARPCESRGALVASVAQAGDLHAGLVVETPDGTRTYCVAFTEAEQRDGFDGIELLQRAGLTLVLGGTRDTAAVCRIGDLGCVDPGDCFCQCRVASDQSCQFWGYYTLDGNRWTFSQTSASLRRLKAGDVDGWRFGNHAGGAGVPPAVPSQRCANAPAATTATGPGATTATGPGATTGATTAATQVQNKRGRGLPVAWIAAGVIALAFAGGIAYGARARKTDPA